MKHAIGIAAALAALTVPVATSAQTVTPEYKQQLINEAKARNVRNQARFQEFAQHRRNVQSQLAAARARGDQAEIARLQAINADDERTQAGLAQRNLEHQQHVRNIAKLQTAPAR